MDNRRHATLWCDNFLIQLLYEHENALLSVTVPEHRLGDCHIASTVNVEIKRQPTKLRMYTIYFSKTEMEGKTGNNERSQQHNVSSYLQLF